MNDHSLGLYTKFRVERMNGSSAPGQKHDGCEYFVLDLDHDPYAKPALAAYAAACRAEYPALADDLEALSRGAAAEPTAGKPTKYPGWRECDMGHLHRSAGSPAGGAPEHD